MSFLDEGSQIDRVPTGRLVRDESTPDRRALWAAIERVAGRAPSAELDLGAGRYTVQMGDDPLGRGEPTLFYRDAKHPERGECYLWVSILTADDRARFGLAPAA
jgi:hypothetical protein